MPWSTLLLHIHKVYINVSKKRILIFYLNIRAATLQSVYALIHSQSRSKTPDIDNPLVLMMLSILVPTGLSYLMALVEALVKVTFVW